MGNHFQVSKKRGLLGPAGERRTNGGRCVDYALLGRRARNPALYYTRGWAICSPAFFSWQAENVKADAALSLWPIYRPGKGLGIAAGPAAWTTPFLFGFPLNSTQKSMVVREHCWRKAQQEIRNDSLRTRKMEGRRWRTLILFCRLYNDRMTLFDVGGTIYAARSTPGQW